VTRIRLKTPSKDDIAIMWRAETREGFASTWRANQSSVSPAEFESIVWDGVLDQYLVLGVLSDVPLGVVSAYAYDAWNGHCKIGMCSYSVNAFGVMLGAIHLVEKLFDSLPLHKIYFEIPSTQRLELRIVESRLATHEGTIRAYRQAAGNDIDLHIVSIFRRDWEDPLRSRLRRLKSQEAFGLGNSLALARPSGPSLI
jgi:hypothetical protein